MQFHKILHSLLIGSYIGLAEYHISQQISYSLLSVQLNDKPAKKGDGEAIRKNILFQLPGLKVMPGIVFDRPCESNTTLYYMDESPKVIHYYNR